MQQFKKAGALCLGVVLGLLALQISHVESAVYPLISVFGRYNGAPKAIAVNSSGHILTSGSIGSPLVVGTTDPTVAWGPIQYVASFGNDETAGTTDYAVIIAAPTINANGQSVWGLLEVPTVSGTAAIDLYAGMASYPQLTATGVVSQYYGIDVVPEVGATSTVTSFYVSQMAPEVHAGATIASMYGTKVSSHLVTGGTITSHYSFWSGAFGGLATNPYSFWSDEQGVYRIRADNTFNSVYQAIPALYNPQFTKYTAGATNYERCIPACQWESNVAVYTTEKGGTGTLRGMRIGDTGVPVSLAPFTTVGTTSLSVANVGANSCGTSAASIAGNDNIFVITVGATAGTQCRVTFPVAASNRRVCVVTDSTTTIATRATYVDTTHTDFLGAFVAGDTVEAVCIAR